MAVEIATILVDSFEIHMASNSLQNHDQPWLMLNKNGDTPLLLAIHYKLEDLASYLLQKDPKKTLIASAEKENPLKLAADSRCIKVVVNITKIITAHEGLRTLLTFSDCSIILEVALNCPVTDAEMFSKEVLENFPSLFTQNYGEAVMLLNAASHAGQLWLVELMVKYYPILKDICVERRDTPLHHIRKGTYAEYQRLLQLKVIEEMKNIPDVKYETPLHKSIRRKDLSLTEALLKMHGIELNLVDNCGETAMDLLAEEAKRDRDWSKLCKVARIDPILKITYAEREAEYLLKLREVLLVVAALLATITFQAGFTLPGGLNSSSGEAVLAKKPAFVVFLLADAYALCCSVLVLFCLVWSMSCDKDKSIILVGHSVSILFQSLYGSLVAFMSGVFIVISRTSLWPPIIIIVMCSFVGLGAMNREILCKLLDMFGMCNKLIDVLLGFVPIARRRSQTNSPPTP